MSSVIDDLPSTVDAPAACVVCLERPRNTRLPCGHEIMCSACAVAVLKLKGVCPACRTKFTKIKFSCQFGQVDFVPSRQPSLDQQSRTSTDLFIEQRVSHEKVFTRRSLEGTKLVLDGACRLQDQLLKVCQKLVEPSCSIVSLSLANNFMGPQEATFLAEALSHNYSLQFLNVSNNNLGVEGTKILCVALLKHPSLREVHFSSNQLGSDGAEEAAKLIQENNVIECLRLYENQIGDRGCRSLAKALESNKNLKDLSLRSNKISECALQYLAKKLHHNQTLERLDVCFNSSVRTKDFPTRVQLAPSPIKPFRDVRGRH